MTQENVLCDGQLRYQSEVLIDNSNACLLGSVGTLQRDLTTVHQGVANVRLQRSTEDIQEGRFAGTVLAHQGVYLAGKDSEGYLVQGTRPAEVLHDLPGFQHPTRHAGFSPSAGEQPPGREEPHEVSVPQATMVMS